MDTANNAPFSLDGRIALVTGAAGYLGREICRALSQAGARVLVNGRTPESVHELVRALTAAGGQAEAAIFDVTDEKAIRSYFANRSDPLHILVHNAYAGGAGTIELSQAESYDDSHKISVVAAQILMSSALPALRLAVAQTGEASIINVSSMYALVSPDLRLYDTAAGANPPFYGAAKAALLAWTRYAACEFGKENIRVNSISPGPFPSQKVQSAHPDFVSQLANRVPMGRVGQAHEIGGPILFLASPASSFVNGANLTVDGGWTAW